MAPSGVHVEMVGHLQPKGTSGRHGEPVGPPELLSERGLALHRAAATLSTIRKPRFYSRRRHLYGRRRLFVLRSYEHLWPYADAWSAAATLASLPGSPAAEVLGSFVDGLAAYGRGVDWSEAPGPVGFESSVVPPLGRGGDRYVDDNAWLGLAALVHHDVTGDPRLLDLARRLFSFAVSAWSNDPGWVRPGGIRWKQAVDNRSRHTCSNAPVAELGVAIHQRTGDEDSLGWAVRIYGWVRSTLLEGNLYGDKIWPDGRLDPTIWTYNQGTMIGAGVLLAEATGERDYLEEAIATARAAHVRFSPLDLLRQDPAFNAVYLRNLLLLDRAVGDPAHRAVAVGYGNAMWHQVRDPRSGLFRQGPSFLNDTAPMIEVYALIAGAEPHP
jgi:hypothetical protein